MAQRTTKRIVVPDDIKSFLATGDRDVLDNPFMKFKLESHDWRYARDCWQVCRDEVLRTFPRAWGRRFDGPPDAA